MNGLLSLLEDPHIRAALLQSGLGLMASKERNLGNAMGQAGLMGVNAYHTSQGLADRREQEKQEREQRGLMMEQMRQQKADQDNIRSVFSRNFMPGNLTPNDDEGNQMPPAPMGMNMQGLIQGLQGAGPQGFQMAQAMMPRPRGPVALSEGGMLVDPNTGRQIAANPKPEKKENPFGKIIPSDYTPDSFRKFVASGNHADLVPYRKPDAPKTADPRLYDGPEGPVWITPPGAGQPGQTLPVTGPDGKPIAAKKRNQPVTEAQAKAKLYVGMMDDAEQAISGLKFDPTSLTNQTQIALARGDLPVLPKVLQNSAASKDAQLYAQSTFQWTEAVLRQLTGAAAPEGEVWRQVKTYWPQPGDSKEVIARKAQARQAVTEQVRGISGEQRQGGGASGGWGIREIN